MNNKDINNIKKESNKTCDTYSDIYSDINSDTEYESESDTQVDLDKLEKEFMKEHKIRNSKYRDNPNIIGKQTKFSEKLFKMYDIPARDVIKEILGDFVKDHPNKYEQDLIITSPTCKYKYMELQVCANWYIEYPYDTVFVYARKSRYGSDTLFLTLNKTLTKCFIFDADSLNGVKPRRIKKYSREFVYDIPWHRVMQLRVDDLDKETIEFY